MRYRQTIRCFKSLACCAYALFIGAQASVAQEGVRYYEEKGLLYRETTIKIRHPVQEMNYKEVTETVNRDQYYTELKPYVRNTYVPVTTYAWQPEIYGKWNPLGQSHVAYRPVPKVSWSVQPQTIQVPVTRRVTTPKKRIRKVPQTSLKYVEREYVQKIPVGPAPTSGTFSRNANERNTNATNRNTAPPSNRGAATGHNGTQLKQVYHPPTQRPRPQELFGGVARLEADPPRVGFSSNNGQSR